MGLLVRVNNVTMQGEPDQWGQLNIDDGSGPTQLDDPEHFDSIKYVNGLLGANVTAGESAIWTGHTFHSITGTVNYAHGVFELFPRARADFCLTHASCEPPSPPTPETLWGSLVPGQVGVLVATDPITGTTFSLKRTGEYYLNGANATHPMPNRPGRAYSVSSFRSQQVNESEGVELQLDPQGKGHLLLFEPPTPSNFASTIGLHINCGDCAYSMHTPREGEPL